jgi:hypothetical protein
VHLIAFRLLVGIANGTASNEKKSDTLVDFLFRSQVIKGGGAEQYGIAHF